MKKRKRYFSPLFKIDAVKLWENSGRQSSSVGKQLGIRPALFSVWKRRFTQQKPAHTASDREAGFAVGAILFVLTMAGVAGAVLFSGTSQVLRTNIEITRDNTAKNDLLAAARTLSASSTLINSGLNVQPPAVLAFGSADAARLPTGYASAGSAGTPTSVGVMTAGAGTRQLDPWNKYFIYCRWEGLTSPGTDPGIMLISAGPDGVLNTNCGSSTAQNDDKIELLSVGQLIDRANVWQYQNPGTPQVQFGIGSNAVKATDAGDLTANSLTLAGALNAASLNLSAPLPITQGGTGSTTAGAARTSLGSGTTGDSLFTTTTAAGARGVLGSTTVGDALFIAATAGAGRTALGATATGSSLFTATDAAAARTTLGATSVGDSVFTATDAAAGRTALGATTVGDGLFTAADAAAARSVLAAGATGDSLFQTTTAASARSVLGAGATGESVFAAANQTAALTALGLIGGSASLDIGITGTANTATYLADGGNILAGTVPIARGGTGAGTPATARAALGADNATNLTSGTLSWMRLPTSGVVAGTYNWGTVNAYGIVTAAQSLSSSSNGTCAVGIQIGQTCPDGSIYAGFSPDGTVAMYTTPCDAGSYLNNGTCTACSSGLWTGSGSTCSTSVSSSRFPTWNNGTANWTTTGYTSFITGRTNTSGLSALVDGGSPYRAATYCDTLTAFGKDDWYLPARDELKVLYTNRTAVGNFNTTDGSNAISGAYPGLYWSASETDTYNAWYQRFSDGSQINLFGDNKNELMGVRCVRNGWTATAGASSTTPFSGLTAASATNSINNADYAQTWAWNTLSSNSGLTLSSSSTAAAGNTQTLLNVALSGANATSTQTTYGAQIANTHTGTTSTNVGLSVSASGGTNNYGLLVPSGRVGIGTTTPATRLDVNGSVRVANDTTACTSTISGAIRYNGSGLDVCTNNVWTGLSTTSSPPNAFSFTDQTGVALSSTITSNSVTLTGFIGSLTATCVNCTAIARNGVWGGTTLAGFVAGNTIAIRQTSSGTAGFATTATVTVGGTTSSTWTVTTTNSGPNPFSFTNVTGATTNITYSSNAVTLSGFSGSLTATCSGSCFSIARNGVWGGISLDGFVSGDTIALRMNSKPGAGDVVTAVATVGITSSSTWTVTTSAACAVGIQIGQTCPDGSIYAGFSPDGTVAMYTTPCDAGSYLNNGTCTACSSGLWTGSGSTCSTSVSSSRFPTWNNGTANWTTTGYTSFITGRTNTSGLSALVDGGSPYRAATYCDTLTAFGKDDWYLPARDELKVLYTNRTAVGNFNTTDGSNAISGAYPGLYWSSSEYYNDVAWTQRFSDGLQFYGNKSYQLAVRCVRR